MILNVKKKLTNNFRKKTVMYHCIMKKMMIYVTIQHQIITYMNHAKKSYKFEYSM
jgi:hypothetical protein